MTDTTMATRHAEGGDAQRASIDLRPIHKSIVIDRPLVEVFELFVERPTSWWPVASHSIGGDRVTEIIHERSAGGRFYERLSDGTEYAWGRILAFEPPHRIVYAWDPSPVPRTPTEVEVRFIEEGAARTRVELEHRGWEGIGDRAAGRVSYDSGWDLVLGQLAQTASAS